MPTLEEVCGEWEILEAEGVLAERIR